MISRLAALGCKVDLATPDDVDTALHEMTWLTVRQRAIEAPGKAQAEEIKRAKLVVDVEGGPLTFAARWETLQAAVFRWCENHLKKHVPPKKSLKLSRGELKSRTLVAAVANANGVPLQMNAALIASLLIQLRAGRQPKKRTFESIQFYLLGWVSDDELDAHLAALEELPA